MKTWFSMLVALLATSHQGQAQTISLDELISHPGSYSQLCDVMSAPSDIPYHPYQLSSFLGASFSKKKLDTARKNRESLIKEIQTRLLEIEFNRKPETAVKDPHPDESMEGDDVGCDPKALNPLLLSLILDLHAIEALPELLMVEDKLVQAISITKNNAGAPAPWVDGWFVLEEKERSRQGSTADEKSSREKLERQAYLFNARSAQRDLVMTMGRLLREKEYEPYLDTALEKAFVEGIKKQALEGKFSQLKPGDEIPETLKNSVSFDPITHLPYMFYPPVTVPYSRESRDEVRASAQKWISEHP